MVEHPRGSGHGVLAMSAKIRRVTDESTPPDIATVTEGENVSQLRPTVFPRLDLRLTVIS